MFFLLQAPTAASIQSFIPFTARVMMRSRRLLLSTLWAWAIACGLNDHVLRIDSEEVAWTVNQATILISFRKFCRIRIHLCWVFLRSLHSFIVIEWLIRFLDFIMACRSLYAMFTTLYPIYRHRHPELARSIASIRMFSDFVCHQYIGTRCHYNRARSCCPTNTTETLRIIRSIHLQTKLAMSNNLITRIASHCLRKRPSGQMHYFCTPL